jgi:multimeric flavodoxin WrbA
LEERKMKILCINAIQKGSKSGILKLVKAVLKGAKSKGAKGELVDLCILHRKYCTTCGVCDTKGTYMKEDDFQVLSGKILAAHGEFRSHWRTIVEQI